MPGRQKTAALDMGEICDSLNAALNKAVDLCPDYYLDPQQTFPPTDAIASGWRNSIKGIADALDVCEWHEAELRDRVDMKPFYLCRNDLTCYWMPWERTKANLAECCSIDDEGTKANLAKVSSGPEVHTNGTVPKPLTPSIDRSG